MARFFVSLFRLKWRNLSNEKMKKEIFENKLFSNITPSLFHRQKITNLLFWSPAFYHMENTILISHPFFYFEGGTREKALGLETGSFSISYSAFSWIRLLPLERTRLASNLHKLLNHQTIISYQLQEINLLGGFLLSSSLKQA